MSVAEELFAGRYRLERRLGVGGMSTVQLAFDTNLERYVAVKLLAEHLAEDDGFVQRFRREALAAGRLIHPNVVAVYDFGTDDATGRQFIAMEYVEGESGAELLREHGRLPADEVVDLCAQSCRGLDYAHRNGVVHRDIKPGNLLRNREGIVKLADFGIAKAADDSDITRVGSVIGTAAYLAPEQARGEPAGPQSDLYALGVVAYQMVAGRLPYQGSSLTELARQQEEGPPTDVFAIVPDCPPALSAAIMKALVADPEHRYASAPEMERALRDAMKGIAPPTDEATVALAGTDATRALPSQPRTRAHRPLEPMYEDAPPPPPRRRPVEPEPERAPRKRRSVLPFVLMALIVAALIAGVVYLNETANGPSTTTFNGGMQQTLDDLRGAISDNTK
jgi:serine/threonine protein kinase